MPHAVPALRSAPKARATPAQVDVRVSAPRKGKTNVRHVKRTGRPAGGVLQAADPPPVDAPNPLTADGLSIGLSDPAVNRLVDTAGLLADPTVLAATTVASDPRVNHPVQPAVNPRARKRGVRPKIHGTIERADRMRVYPTPDQAHPLARLLGATRFVWNGALDRRTMAYRTEDIELDWMMLSKEMTELRRAPTTAWLSEMPSEPFNQVLRNHDKAFSEFLQVDPSTPSFTVVDHKQGFDSPWIRAASR